MATLRVGVTGLSQAGKTVFLTSIIYHLVECTAAALPKLQSTGVEFSGKINNSKISGEVFPYAEHIVSFRSDNRTWPPPTEQESAFRVKLRVKQGKRPRTIHVEFFDYPGELLADVPLYYYSYKEWCERITPALSDTEGLAPELYKKWRSAEDQLVSGTVGDECDVEFDLVASCYRALCRELQRTERLILPPVRPLMTDADNSKAKDWPLFPLAKATIKARPDIVEKLRRVFDDYRQQEIRPFVRRLSQCDKHVVLVDLLNILKGRGKRFNRVRSDLTDALKSFEYLGRRDLIRNAYLRLRSIARRPCIREVLFCATKADQVKRDTRSNLEQLLKQLVDNAAADMKMGGITPWYTLCSSVRTTKDGVTVHKGNDVGILMGVPKDSQDGKEEWKNPSDVPEEWPPFNKDWPEKKFCDFSPIRFPDIFGAKVPNIRLDEIIYKLLEDYL